MVKNESTEDPKSHLYLPEKKFSTLSDIIERSHEGSSTYEYGKFSSSNGNREYPDKIDEIADLPEEEDSKDSPLLKFGSLPQDAFKKKNFKKNEKVDLRRASTAQRMNNINEES